MTARDRVTRILRQGAGLPATAERFADRHSLERLLATPDAELERSGRCSCRADQLGEVRCLLTGDAPSGVCRWCAEFCADTPAD